MELWEAIVIGILFAASIGVFVRRILESFNNKKDDCSSCCGCTEKNCSDK